MHACIHRVGVCRSSRDRHHRLRVPHSARDHRLHCTMHCTMQARRADDSVVELLKELNTGNAAMKDATDGVGTGNVGALTSVVASLNQVVAEMKSLRSDNTKVRRCLR